MKYPLRADSYTLPQQYRLDVQIWDKDLLTKNDYLSNVTIDAWECVLGCIIEGRSAILKPENAEYDGEKKFVAIAECRRPGDHKGEKSRITLSVECLTKSE